MGLIEAVRARQTHMGEQRFVDETGRSVPSIPAAFMSGDLEILRGDLSRILYDATCDHTEYLFGDSVQALAETPDGVEVRFERAAPRRFDRVVGADGMHSQVRTLHFPSNGGSQTESGVPCTQEHSHQTTRTRTESRLPEQLPATLRRVKRQNAIALWRKNNDNLKLQLKPQRKQYIGVIQFDLYPGEPHMTWSRGDNPKETPLRKIDTTQSRSNPCIKLISTKRS
jgi:2-polyprenyl-6-methoxyphenol hydroxylase-like FAD-dependent oxidoreductase